MTPTRSAAVAVGRRAAGRRFPARAPRSVLNPEREADREDLLAVLSRYSPAAVPCLAVPLAVAAAWTSEDTATQAAAAAACRPCPVRSVCLGYGGRWPDEAGTYGGRTEQDRQRVAREVVARPCSLVPDK